jgi:hypothetical protein
MKLTVLFDGDAGQQAYDSLNTLRDLQRKMRDEQRRKSNHTPTYTALQVEWDDMAGELAETVLDAAVIWHDTDGGET